MNKDKLNAYLSTLKGTSEYIGFDSEQLLVSFIELNEELRNFNDSQLYSLLASSKGTCGWYATLFAQVLTGNKAGLFNNFYIKDYPMIFGDSKIYKNINAPKTSELIKNFLGSYIYPGTFPTDLEKFSKSKLVQFNNEVSTLEAMKEQLKMNKPVMIALESKNAGHFDLVEGWAKESDTFLILEASYFGISYLTKDELLQRMDMKNNHCSYTMSIDAIQMLLVGLLGPISGSLLIVDGIFGSNKSHLWFESLKEISKIEAELNNLKRFNIFIF